MQLTRPLVEWGRQTASARLAVLAVHGRSQDPGFMRDVADRLDVPDVRFFAPHAEGGSWYPRPFLEPRVLNEPQLECALEELSTCLRYLRNLGFESERIHLLGFSQGACLLAHYVLTRAPRIGGLALLTGGFVGAEPIDEPGSAFLNGVPAVVRSIENDPFVPSSRVRETSQLLRAAGAVVDERIDPGHEHVITDEALAAVSSLLRGGRDGGG